MLAGLVHNIGALPILTRAEEIPALLQDEEIFASLLKRLSGPIGASIMESWHFPEELINVAKEHQNYSYDSEKIDYVDVVIVANDCVGRPQPSTRRNERSHVSDSRRGVANTWEALTSN